MSAVDNAISTIIDAVKATPELIHLLDDNGLLDIDHGLPPVTEEMDRPCLRIDGLNMQNNRIDQTSFLLKLWMRSTCSTEETTQMLSSARIITSALKATGRLRVGSSQHRPNKAEGIDCVHWTITAYAKNGDD